MFYNTNKKCFRQTKHSSLLHKIVYYTKTVTPGRKGLLETNTLAYFTKLSKRQKMFYNTNKKCFRQTKHSSLLHKIVNYSKTATPGRQGLHETNALAYFTKLSKRQKMFYNTNKKCFRQTNTLAYYTKLYITPKL
jgi:hypothetical protein